MSLQPPGWSTKRAKAIESAKSASCHRQNIQTDISRYEPEMSLEIRGKHVPNGRVGSRIRLRIKVSAISAGSD